MDIEYKMYIGLNDKDTHKQEVTTNKAIELVSLYFECCTVQEVTGCYKREQEKSLIVSVIDNEQKRPDIKRAVENLKFLLNQECILVTETELNKMEVI
jgi:hypothetical protein